MPGCLNARLTASLLGLTALCAVAQAQTASLTITAPAGTIEGLAGADGKTHTFKGIPYAAPPVGDLRWKEPQPALPLKGTFSAKDYGNHCAQADSFADMIFHDPAASEDCLSLNIWTPADAKPGAKLPVMFWVHGGGYYAGGSSEARHDGQALARHGVIVVTINYRLGVFGFFVPGEAAAESAHHSTGNYGLMDQLQALQWTHDNIAAFGGDPANVTVFGESAGSFSVGTLMASPLSKNLMAKAIGESGGALGSSSHPTETLEAREAKDAALAEKAFKTSKLAELRKLSTEQILAGVSTTKAHFGPDVDGYFLPKPVSEIYAAGEQAHVPLIGGWNNDEMRAAVLLKPEKPTVATYSEQAKKDYGPAAPEFLKLYPGTTDAEALQSAGDLVSDRFIVYSTWKWLEAQVKTGGAPVYRYLFALPAPTDKYHPVKVGTFHSDDIEYVFGTLDSRPGATFTADDRATSERFEQYWTNFAKTGDPNGAGLAKWPVYKPTEFEVMRLDAHPAAAPDKQRDRYLFFESHPLKAPTM